MKKIGIILLILLVLAAITKPSENSFKNHIKSELTAKTDDNVLEGIIKSGLKIQSGLSNEYDDKIFYSLARTSIGSEKIEFIGVFGFWIKR